MTLQYTTEPVALKPSYIRLDDASFDTPLIFRDGTTVVKPSLSLRSERSWKTCYVLCINSRGTIVAYEGATEVKMDTKKAIYTYSPE